ncbi:hypothetical protein C8Q77DRAFT_1069576 [Trametes polyzona]|nr:hypothetical protein C8Q77DRAFT_1069576 [Trametes polyzona]
MGSLLVCPPPVLFFSSRLLWACDVPGTALHTYYPRDVSARHAPACSRPVEGCLYASSSTPEIALTANNMLRDALACASRTQRGRGDRAAALKASPAIQLAVQPGLTHRLPACISSP